MQITYSNYIVSNCIFDIIFVALLQKFFRIPISSYNIHCLSCGKLQQLSSPTLPLGLMNDLNSLATPSCRVSAITNPGQNISKYFQYFHNQRKCAPHFHYDHNIHTFHHLEYKTTQLPDNLSFVSSRPIRVSQRVNFALGLSGLLKNNFFQSTCSFSPLSSLYIIVVW